MLSSLLVRRFAKRTSSSCAWAPEAARKATAMTARSFLPLIVGKLLKSFRRLVPMHFSGNPWRYCGASGTTKSRVRLAYFTTMVQTSHGHRAVGFVAEVTLAGFSLDAAGL